jgi:predicted Zn-dependent protease
MKYDILSIHEQSSTVKLEANEITSVKNSDIQRYGVRRFENGRQFQTSRLGEASGERLITDTKEWGGPGVPHEYGFAPAHEESRAGIAVAQDHLAEFEDCSIDLAKRNPQFVFTGKCSVNNGRVDLTSNYGLKLQTSGGSCDWYVTYQRKGSGNMMDGFLFESTAKPQIRREFENHAEFLRAQMTEAAIKGGRMPVLLVDSLAPLAKLRQSMVINRYKEGTCLFAGKLGEQLFSPQVTLLDRAYIPESGNNQFFDGEGVVRSNDDHTLIEKGKFIGLQSDLRFGKKFNSPSTGNGVRAYNGGVTLGSRTLCFAKGQKPWREIVRGLDRCLVAVITAGGDSNDLGEFSTPVQLGYIFEKGQLVGRAPQVTVKTALTDYLGKNLIAAASDSFVSCSPSASLIAEMEVILN